MSVSPLPQGAQLDTLPEDVPNSARTGAGGASRLAFAIAWCEGAPERTGEVALLASSDRVLGRGGPAADDPAPRLEFGRERGGTFERRPLLELPSLSRVQLRVRVSGDRVAVENLGKLRLERDGQEVATAALSEGDLVALGAQLLLVVVRRQITPGQQDIAPFAFGGPDANGIVGESSAVWALRDAIAFVAAHQGHVLIRGESGTGKELVAQAIHRLALHTKGGLVSRNAATFPEALIDAELFGNVRNYPNPGMPERVGLVGEADGGTLFLDEFAELPYALQTHLLRLLDAGEYQRLGEVRKRHASFRFVAATNRPLSALKDDLLARLVHRIEVPTLAARREDVPLIARHLFRRMARNSPSLARWIGMAGEPRFSFALVRVLMRRATTTNVRELEATLFRAAARSRGERLEPATEDDVTFGPPLGISEDEGERSADSRVQLTPARIKACLDAHNGVLESAWRPLGLPSRFALSRLVRKHNIEIRRRPTG